MDWKLAVDIVDQLKKRVGKEMRCYFEITVPDGVGWRVGELVRCDIAGSGDRLNRWFA